MNVHVFRFRRAPADVGGSGGETGPGLCRLSHANESAFCCQLNADPVVNVRFPSAGTLAAALLAAFNCLHRTTSRIVSLIWHGFMKPAQAAVCH